MQNIRLVVWFRNEITDGQHIPIVLIPTSLLQITLLWRTSDWDPYVTILF